MKSTKTRSVRCLQFLIGMGLIMSIYSCGGNQNESDASPYDASGMSDSGNMNSNTMNLENGMRNGAENSNNADVAFMTKAAEINMEEIKLGQLALQKSTASHVKELATMMVAEHTKAMTELTAMAKTKTTALPTNEPPKLAYNYKMLNEKSGKEFDMAYSEMMVNGHKEAISLFESTNNETTDADIKSMTAAMIPKLKTHLEHSEQCKKACEKK